MGPWLANNIRECDGLASLMSYWDLSDVFEEQGVVKTPFYGGYGLIAERNIPKAAFRVFEFLHRVGDQRLEAPSENVLITKRTEGSYVVALCNYAESKSEVASKTFQLASKGFNAKRYRMQLVAPGSGSALEAWRAMGSPAYPTRAQIEQLKKSSEMPPVRESPISKRSYWLLRHWRFWKSGKGTESLSQLNHSSNYKHSRIFYLHFSFGNGQQSALNDLLLRQAAAMNKDHRLVRRTPTRKQRLRNKGAIFYAHQDHERVNSGIPPPIVRRALMTMTCNDRKAL
jgi:hypothetical protein